MLLLLMLLLLLLLALATASTARSVHEDDAADDAVLRALPFVALGGGELHVADAGHTTPPAALPPPRHADAPRLSRRSSTMQVEYDEALAHNLIVCAGFALNERGPVYCSPRAFMNITMTFNASIAVGGIKSMVRGYMGVQSAAKRIVLAFQGTVGGEEQLLAEVLGGFGVAFDGVGGRVMQYPATAIKALRAFYLDRLLWLRERLSPRWRLYVTGHSLGGALATLAAADLVANTRGPGRVDGRNVTLYTFGGPRTGDYTFAAWLDARVGDHWRVVNAADAVVHLPPCVAPPGGRCAAVPLNPYHSGAEAWYPVEKRRDGRMYGDTQCIERESRACSAVVFPAVSWRDHDFYWHAMCCVCYPDDDADGNRMPIGRR